MGDPLEQRWGADQVAVMEALQHWAVGFMELNQHMSEWMALPTSDANALGQIVWAAQGDEPLSPARLARRIGMTSGAATVLLNRLEKAGLIERSREHTDRRRVTLRPTALARDKARSFTVASSAEIVTALRALSAEDLPAAARVLSQMTLAVNSANTRLMDGASLSHSD